MALRVERAKGQQIVITVDGIEQPLVITVRKRQGRPVLIFSGPRLYRVLRKEIHDRDPHALKPWTCPPGIYSPEQLAAALNARSTPGTGWRWNGKHFHREVGT